MKIWSGIWDQPGRHNNKAQWLKEVETRLRGAKKEGNITVPTEKLKKQQ